MLIRARSGRCASTSSRHPDHAILSSERDQSGSKIASPTRYPQHSPVDADANHSITPMNMSLSIARHVAYAANRLPAQHSLVIIAGPRATGKTLLASTLYPHHRLISRARPREAARAPLDPAAFLAGHPPPLVIDDVHLAPRLIHHVGRLLGGQSLPPASYVLVGARPLLLAAAADEASAGRPALIHVHGLTHAEVSAARPDLTLDERLLRGGFPALYAAAEPDVAGFMRDLVADHLIRDLPEQLRVDSVHAFEPFLRAVAARSSGLLNKAELARAVGIAGSTAAIWLDTLVEAGIVAVVKPASSPQARGVVKAAKLHFLDTGLCSYLLGIRTADELATSPHAPAIWEAAVHRELRRLGAEKTPVVEPAFWRDRTKEADFVMTTPRGLVLLDTSWSEYPATA
ncbi:MAG: ATP-binding protein, partial [Planctomycetia bacterium]